MFSTKLNSYKRFILPCLIIVENPIKHLFLVDTGAKYTCCNIYNINPTLKEAYFQNVEYKILGGFINGGVAKYYKYHVKQFTIGNIDMKSQDIWVTFDSRATDDVLGMDILSQVFFFYECNGNDLIFSNNANEIKEFITQKSLKFFE